ncbi:hypothetical protein DSY4653 [Desulfitobacterium hafniense Y51]|uniref:Uncharacterized protein n=1 Tax=Desulfitobacterium hafniense (strain Y51) TaxID=138119 RepID=Q24NF0_DESHY|nr:hypothetical protein DSY4653 [Desulfitobacterium hafniense Y51]
MPNPELLHRRYGRTIKICSTQFCEEKNSKDEVDCREYHLVDHGLNLTGSVVPGAFNCSRHVTCGRCGVNSRTKRKDHQQNHKKNGQDSFRLHHKLPPFI